MAQSTSVDTHDALQLAALRAALEPLDWPARFDRLALEDKSASAAWRARIEQMRMTFADAALDELRTQWGDRPLKDGVLQLPSKRMRGALGQAAKRARDRAIVEMMNAVGDPFAAGVGVGMDERVVEIPLALQVARLDQPGEVLDAGSALNVPVVRQIAGRPAARVTHFTLPGSVEPELPDDADRYVRSFGDLRALPFAHRSFQRVVCVSTLEHVGLDNARFGAATENRDPESASTAVGELARVLAPGGTLLITVPYGQAADRGWFRVFDAEGLSRLLAPLAGLETAHRYFFYGHGWTEAGPHVPPARSTPMAEDVITGVAIVVARRSDA